MPLRARKNNNYRKEIKERSKKIISNMNQRRLRAIALQGVKEKIKFLIKAKNQHQNFENT